MQYRLEKKTARIKRINMWIGTTICALLAALAALVFNPFHFKSLLPFAFIAVLMFVSQRFGAGAGLLGGVATAMIFAYFSPPVATLHVADATLRANLSWMLLLGIPAGYFVSDSATSSSNTTATKDTERR
jgi:K+-sensing histidine kinase KdpD